MEILLRSAEDCGWIWVRDRSSGKGRSGVHKTFHSRAQREASFDGASNVLLGKNEEVDILRGAVVAFLLKRRWALIHLRLGAKRQEHRG